MKQWWVGIISSKKVAQVMESIDRGLFVPDGIQSYVDTPLAIWYNATISAPHMHAACLELLLENLQPGMHALDVGSGHVIGIEHIPELASTSLENIKKVQLRHSWRKAPSLYMSVRVSGTYVVIPWYTGQPSVILLSDLLFLKVNCSDSDNHTSYYNA